MKKTILLIFYIGLNLELSAQNWNSTGDNVSTGNLAIGSTTESSYSKITINGPNQPTNSDSKRDLSFEFASAGSAILRAYRGGSWDTYLQLLTTPNSGGMPLSRIHINGDGNIGIGTTTPSVKLDINGTILARNGGFNSSFTGTQFLMGYGGTNEYMHAIKTRHHGGQDAENSIDFYVWDFGTDTIGDAPTKLVMTIDGANTGNVGIGTTDTKGFKLGVLGKIAAEEVKVAIYNNWADFVFENNYNLPTLKEVEQHIKENGHLKDIPSAKDVKENGVFLGEMDSKLLQKIEELTLYAIKQEKEIENSEEEINFLNNKIEKLERENKELQSISKRLSEIELLLKNKNQ